jgi:hypothetical protein
MPAAVGQSEGGIDVLVLVSFGLVLLATILLVVGLLADDGLTLIYLSIGASFTAAIVLYLAFRMARPKTEVTKTAPEPLGTDLEPEREPVTVGAEPTRVQAVATAPAPAPAPTPTPAPVAEPEPTPAPTPAAPAAEATPTGDDDWTTDDDWADDGEFEIEFPIADYDDLTVAEIMPLLPQLYSDELGIVAERERTTKNRASILDRLDELAASGTEADALETDEVAGEVEPESAPAPTPAPGRRTPPPVTVPSLSDDDDDELPFPIADYDELTVDQIVPLLAQLEDDELEEVKEREVTGQARKTIVTEIDRHLGLLDAADDGWRAEDTPAAASPAPAPRSETPEGSALAIAGYDGLTVAEIRPLLAGLSDHELRAVLEHEAARDNRRTIIADIERRLNAGGATATPAARPAKKAAKRSPRTAKKAAATKAAAKRFPIANYDELTVAEIRPRLSGLSKAQLEQVRERELAGAGRKTILNDIDNRLS